MDINIEYFTPPLELSEVFPENNNTYSEKIIAIVNSGYLLSIDRDKDYWIYLYGLPIDIYCDYFKNIENISYYITRITKEFGSYCEYLEALNLSVNYVNTHIRPIVSYEVD